MITVPPLLALILQSTRRPRSTLKNRAISFISFVDYFYFFFPRDRFDSGKIDAPLEHPVERNFHGSKLQSDCTRHWSHLTSVEWRTVDWFRGRGKFRRGNLFRSALSFFVRSKYCTLYFVPWFLGVVDLSFGTNVWNIDGKFLLIIRGRDFVALGFVLASAGGEKRSGKKSLPLLLLSIRGFFCSA